ncbi:MAG: phenylalanine--tRNA ligase subunit alpha [Gemmatimonadetes bacterium]|nr:phenylalanine--tRNA ligase subunit alpha [Gemmatimonadota bacterium]
MTLAELLSACDDLRAAALGDIAAVPSLEAWTELRTHLVGRKGGRVTQLMSALPTLAAEDRRTAGAAINALKDAVEGALDARAAALRAASAGGPALDLTMPGRPAWRGSRHPVTLVIDEITDIFRELGFTIALGPEAETEWYNFGALNFPPDHPAMDMHDTLYLAPGTLLRTHTSPVQVRTMQRWNPPIRVLAPGNVYRRDFFDATHAPAFAQIEGLAIDEGISFADLKATLTHFAKRFYGATTRTRFGPSFFPFTEPSAQMDVEIDLGDGRGLRWVEIMGTGLVHPAVIEAAGLDSQKYSGWAFGMGPGRIAMSRYGIPDIRLLYDSDVRFLEQFA